MSDNFYFRYCGLYLLPYVGLTLAVIAIAYFTGWEPPSVLNLIIAMCSSYYPAYQFVKDHNRAPEKPEKRRFAGATLLIITVLSTVFVAGLAAIVPGLREELEFMVEQLGAGVFAVIVVVTLLFYYLAIGWGFGQGAKMQIKALEKQREKGTL